MKQQIIDDLVKRQPQLDDFIEVMFRHNIDVVALGGRIPPRLFDRGQIAITIDDFGRVTGAASFKPPTQHHRVA